MYFQFLTRILGKELISNNRRGEPSNRDRLAHHLIELAGRPLSVSHIFSFLRVFFFLSAALPAGDELLPARRGQEPSAAAEHGGGAATATGRRQPRSR